MQTANFTKNETKRNIESFRKEKTFWQEWALIDVIKSNCALRVRFYGAGTVVYCVAWVSCGMGYSLGMGKAGGYGYHKASAAMQEALEDAGFSFSEDFSGRGETAMQEALEAIARLTCIEKAIIHKAHA